MPAKLLQQLKLLHDISMKPFGATDFVVASTAPEDCGGPPGYFEFIENIARNRGKKAEEALE